MTTSILPAYDRLGDIRLLFREYADTLGFDLGYQDFEEELSALPGKYALPAGRLYLAACEDAPAGCVALRPLDDTRCEMKRLYVRPGFRGQKLGLRLIERLIQDAGEIGYRELLLDTLPQMKEAIGIYERLGFAPTEPYYDSPMPGTRYLRYLLRQSPES